MWSAVGGAVLKSVATVAEQLLNENKPREPKVENYNIQGHIHNIPVNLTLSQSAHPSAAAQNTSYQSTERPPSKNQPNNGPRRYNAAKKPKDNFLVVKMPKDSNYEVNIKNTKAQFTKMNLGAQRMPRNDAQKPAGFNTPLKKPPGSNAPSKKPNKQRQQNKTEKGLQNTTGNKKFSSSNPGGTWMYLGRLKIGTTIEDVKSFLIELFPDFVFNVKELPLYKDGKLPCFKVLVDNRALEVFQDPDHWPSGVKITKFHDNFKK